MLVEELPSAHATRRRPAAAGLWRGKQNKAATFGVQAMKDGFERDNWREQNYSPIRDGWRGRLPAGLTQLFSHAVR
jgi:hypothetical protein